MKIKNYSTDKKKISQDEEDKSKLKFFNKSKPFDKKVGRKKLKTEVEEEILNNESESLEVLLGQVDLDESLDEEDANRKKLKKSFGKFTLETIEEETLEALEEHELERNISESIEAILENIDYLNEDLDEDMNDIDELSSPFTEEELKNLIPFIFEKSSLSASSQWSQISEATSMQRSPFNRSFEEFEVYSVIKPRIEIQSCCLFERVLEKDNLVFFENKKDVPVVRSESDVELEEKPSSTNISITTDSSILSVSSVTSVPSLKLVDYITLKQSLSLANALEEKKNESSILSITLQITFRSLYHLICRFLESPHLIYIVIFISSTYLTLNCVFRDTKYGPELVWNVFPSLNTPFSSAAY